MADQTRRKAGGNQPISRHPLFPAIVALWFGALFGLGSIAIEPAFIERAVVAAGIDSVVPMAAPPLGAKARILVALAMIGLGSVIGMLIARRIARPESQVSERRRRTGAIGENRAPAVVSAGEADEEPDLAELDLDGYEDQARQIEAAAPRETISNHLFDAYSREIAPLAVTADQLEDMPEDRPPSIFAQPTESGLNAGPDRGAQGETPAAEAHAEEPALGHRPVEQALARMPDIAHESHAAERIASAELDALSPVELLERLALAMARQRSKIAQAPVPEPEEQAAIPVSTTPEPASFEMPPLDAATAAAADSHEALEEAPDKAAVQPVFAAREPCFQASASESEENEVLTDAPLPQALRPVGYDSIDEEDALPGYVPPRHIGLSPHAVGLASAETAPAPSDEEGDESDEEGEVLEEGYSSLLDLSRPVASRQRLIRIEEPEMDGIEPVVLFPGEDALGTDVAAEAASPSACQEHDAQEHDARRPFDGPGGQDTDETERVLRAALATLQRMSGSAR